MKNDRYDFMDSFYAIIDSPVEDERDDGVIYVGEEPDEFMSDYESDWGDDITFIGEEDEEDYYYTDLGEGFIPLSQGDDVEYETIVIDENYVLDEYETDFAGDIVVEVFDDSEEEVLQSVVVYDEEENDFFNEIDSAESVIQFPESKSLADEIVFENTDALDDRISKQIAKDYLQDREAAVELLPGEGLDDEEDNSWVNDDDLFGNNVDVIIAEDPGKEVEDDDYVDGSFEDWLRSNEGMM